MKELAVALDVIVSFNEIFWLYQWVNILLKKKEFILQKFKKEKTLERILYFTYVITVFCLNRIALTSPYTMVVIIIQNLIAVYCFWQCDVVQLLAIIGGYFFGLFLVGNIEISITGMIGGDALIQATTSEQGIERVLYIIVFAPVWLILNWWLTNFVKKKTVNVEEMKYVALISGIGLVGSIFLGTMMLGSFNIHINKVWYIFIGILTILFFYLSYAIRREKYRIQMSFLEAQNEMLEKNYTRANEFYTSNAKLYHDMNHHFDAIYRLLLDENKKEAMEYIESLRKKDDNESIEIQSGVSVVDAILHEMSKETQKKGVVFCTDIAMLPTDLKVEKRDFCSLVANLLKNAVEAAQKEVSIQIKRVHETIFITVRNDYSVVPVRKNGHFITQKEERFFHGWGTQIIEQIVEKYEGNVEYEIEDGYFNVEVMINEI